MHAKSGGSSGEPPDFLFIPAACRSRKEPPRSVGGEIGRGTRATVCGTQKTGARARGAGDAGAGPRVRGHGHRAQGSGAAGAGAGAGRGCGTRKTEDAGVGRRTQNAEHVDADADAGTGTGARARGHGVQDAGRRTRATGRGLQNTGNGGTKCRRRKTRARGAGRRTRATGRGQQNTGNAGTGRRRRGIGDGAQAPVHGPQRDCIHPPGPATTCRGRSQPGAIRRRDQSAGTFHGWTPAAGTRNNPPGHSQPGAIRHRDLQQPAGAVHSRAPSAAGRRYLSRVRIRITPLPPRTPYMLLPRCTSTDLTS